MSTIFGGLGLAERALHAQQFGLNITQKNIANANTPGYSRLRADFTPSQSDATVPSLGGSGAPTVSVESYRDKFIDYRVSHELQGQGEYDAVSAALQQVETLVNDPNGKGLQASLDNFFNSFSSLSNAPEDMTMRQQVLSRGGELAHEFQRLYSRLQEIQVAQDRSVAGTVDEINDLTKRIAEINTQVLAAKAGNNGEESTLGDVRQQLVEKLSGLIDTSYFETESGALTISTRQGQMLVVGDQYQVLQTEIGSGGTLLRVKAGSTDITDAIKSGKLGGLLEARDRTIDGYLGRLDDLAAGIIARVNAQHSQGSDFNGTQGGDYFVPFVAAVPGSNAGAARAIAVALTDPKKIAAASPGSGPGSNANARLLAGIKDENLMSGGAASITQFYANFVYSVGADMGEAEDNLTTQTTLLTQLKNQRDSATGVSLDEEAINIIRYQKAYQASARMVQVWDSLSQEIIQLLG